MRIIALQCKRKTQNLFFLLFIIGHTRDLFVRRHWRNGHFLQLFTFEVCKQNYISTLSIHLIEGKHQIS